MKLNDWVDNKVKVIDSEFNSFLIEISENGKVLSDVNIYPILTEVFSRGNNYRSMKEREFTDPEDVLYALTKFQWIIANINKKIVFVPSKELFCMFMGWTAKVYNTQLKDSPTDIQDVMQMVNDYLVENQISAGQSGFTKQNLTKFRGQMAGVHGFELVTQKEQNENDRANEQHKSKKELMRQLRIMGSKVPKETKQIK